LAIVKTDEEIETLHASAVQLTRGADRTLVVKIAKSLCKQFYKHLSEDLLEIYCYNVSAFLDPQVIFTLSNEQKSKAITDIKGILCSKADCNMKERLSMLTKVLSEDEQIVAMLKDSSNTESIYGGSRKASSSATSSLSKAKATKTTSPSLVDLGIAEYILYTSSNPPSKGPLLVWLRFVLSGLRILLVTTRRLFITSACSSDVQKLFSKARYWVTPRKNQLSSEMLI
jgi:hypothetical protein